MKAAEFKEKLEEFFHWTGTNVEHNESYWFIILEEWANAQFNHSFENENTKPTELTVPQPHE